jgi:hypothetical protein
MLLRPFAAMKGCDGTVGAETAFGFAGAPMNAGKLPASGPSGIGCAGTSAYAAAAHAKHAAIVAAAIAG